MVLVSWDISVVGELRKAPRINRLAAFCKRLKIFFTLTWVRVVSQAMLPNSILGFKTVMISFCVSQGLRPQKQREIRPNWAIVAFPRWCIHEICNEKFSFGSSHRPSHCISLEALMVWSPRMSDGLVCFLWVKCISWAFFLSKIAPWDFPHLKDRRPSYSRSLMFWSISLLATRCVTSSTKPIDILCAVSEIGCVIKRLVLYRRYRMIDIGEPCGKPSFTWNECDK